MTQPPVFSCHVYVAQPDAEGKVVARAASLPGVSATASSERGALAAIAAELKRTIAGYIERGEPVPWSDQPAPRADDEVERWFPIHF